MTTTLITVIVCAVLMAAQALYIIYLRSTVEDRNSELKGKDEHIEEQDKKIGYLMSKSVFPDDPHGGEKYIIKKTESSTYFVEVYKDGVPWENYAESNKVETLDIIKNLLG